MHGIGFEPWEPEESVGRLWHKFASRLDAPRAHDGAAVDLAQVGGRLAVLFRGLGGSSSVELRPVAPEISGHRLGWRRRLGTAAEAVPRTSFDGEVLRLPERLAVFPSREANAALYVWLAACAAHAPERVDEDDPLRADLAALAAVRAMVAGTLENAPGLRPLYEALCGAFLQQRQVPELPPAEAAVEAVIRRMLGDPAPLSERARVFEAACRVAARPIDPRLAAPRRYRPFRPVPLWPELRPVRFSDGHQVETPETEGPPEEAGEERTHRARRRRADQAERRDSLILHKFEAILSWAEFLNLNRRVDDDDPDSARKAADDQDEIGLGDISKAPATRLKLHLDLAPEDVARERLSGVHLYPEWDGRSGTYLPDHVRVLTSPAEPAAQDAASFLADPETRRRIRAVRRQFEALRPGRVTTRGHLDGDALDLDATVRLAADRRAGAEGSQRIWLQSRPEARDLAVAILLDVSRSTESAVAGGRAVIDIEREALVALAWGLAACGDDFAIHAFSSLRRQRVYVQRCKGFDEAMGPLVEARIAGLRPGFYTRMGAAIRHVAAELAGQAHRRRLLLVITDGKPNDLDHYEGRHGIEDTAMAVREARRMGHAVFGVAIDRTAQSWFPRLFGRGGFALVPEPARLTDALPRIYRQLVAG